MELKTSKHVAFPRAVQEFLQGMINRLIIGNHRYGSPDRRKAYTQRLATELTRYKATGNREHLINIANYALLESLTAPYHDPTAPSATRKEFGK
jgi:hypothetical protein